MRTGTLCVRDEATYGYGEIERANKTIGRRLWDGLGDDMWSDPAGECPTRERRDKQRLGVRKKALGHGKFIVTTARLGLVNWHSKWRNTVEAVGRGR